MTLEQAFADWLENAQVLRRTGHEHDAELLETAIADFREAGEDFITWLTEHDAVLRSSETQSWLRRRWALWLDQGLAKTDGGTRYYLQAIVPQRKHISQARADARRTAHKAA